MFVVIDPAHRLRAEAEATIRRAYRLHHGALPGPFPSQLAAVAGSEGIHCAAALRRDADGFFSECYLDAPIETLVSRHVDGEVPRASIAEIGSLGGNAPCRPSSLFELMAGIHRHLSRDGVDWSFFTATARLRAYLRRAAIPLLEIARADRRRVADPHSWGSYYDSDPRVVIVGARVVPDALRVGA
jgi:hypothetical protein